MKRIIVSAIMAITAVLFAVVPVAATVDKPALSLVDGEQKAYHNILETGDMCFILYYNAYYASTVPPEIASDTLILRLMNGTSELGHVAPYPYYANGYQYGVAAFYLSAADVTTLGLTWGAAYTIQFVANPVGISWTGGGVPDPDSDSVSWQTPTNPKIAIGNQILALGLLLKQSWGVNLVEVKDGVNYYLTSSSTSGSGQDYFQSVLPNLRSLAPQIFTAQVTAPIYKTTIPALTGAPSTYIGGLPVDVTPAATIWGMSKGVLTTLITMLGVTIFIFYLCSKQPELTRFAIMFVGIMVLFLTRMGAIVPIWATVIGVFALFIIGYLLFYEKANA